MPMANKNNLCCFLSNRMLGVNIIPKHVIVCRLIDERLIDERPTSDQEYLKRLVTLLKEAVVKMYHPETSHEYKQMKTVFEEKFAEYVNQKTEYVEVFIEELESYTGFLVEHRKIKFFGVPDEIWQIGREIREHDGIFRGVIEN